MEMGSAESLWKELEEGERLALADLPWVVSQLYCGNLANPSADLSFLLWRMARWHCLSWEL